MKSLLLKDGTRKVFQSTEIMGIINANEDSFYVGSRAGSVESALEKADQMIADGAAVLDIGGESTRPGSLPITAEEEIRRICPVIRAIREKYPEILISADTYRASVAEAAIEAGADIINDITGLTGDPEMIPVCAKAHVPVVIMHSKGSPEHMQDDPQYDDVVEEVYAFLKNQIDAAIAGGIHPQSIMTDIGIGFGKTYEHNITLLRNIRRFQELGTAHLVAVSRKTWIGKLLAGENGTLPSEERLYGTIGSSVYAAMQGVEMVRVHDVKENVQAIRVFEELTKKTDLTKAVISIGSNMGDRRANLEQAVRMMNEKAGTVLNCSEIIETKAYGYTDQDDFLNMAVLLETGLDPHELLDVLHEIENALGRVRVIHWGPRTIDLDIIFYGDRVLNDQDLTVPHPDYQNRDFVLIPLMNIVPHYKDPVTGKEVCEAAEELKQRLGH